MSTELILRNESGSTSAALGTWVNYSPAARAGRSVGFLLAGVLGAAALGWVPILHLVWIPSLLVLGLAMSVVAWRTRDMVKKITGVCPSCDAAIDLDGGRVVPDLHDSCPNCNRILYIARTPGA